MLAAVGMTLENDIGFEFYLLYLPTFFKCTDTVVLLTHTFTDMDYKLLSILGLNYYYRSVI